MTADATPSSVPVVVGTLRAKQGMSFDFAGAPVTLRRGELLAADHPWVRGREQMFEPAENAAVAGSQTVASVETGTAGPGERRRITRRDGVRG